MTLVTSRNGLADLDPDAVPQARESKRSVAQEVDIQLSGTGKVRAS